MAHVIIESDLVVGIFAMSQPHLEGYEEISDDDPRIVNFLNSQNGL